MEFLKKKRMDERELHIERESASRNRSMKAKMAPSNGALLYWRDTMANNRTNKQTTTEKNVSEDNSVVLWKQLKYRKLKGENALFPNSVRGY